MKQKVVTTRTIHIVTKDEPEPLRLKFHAAIYAYGTCHKQPAPNKIDTKYPPF